MNKLILKFEVPLQRNDLPDWMTLSGPILKWAPNRETDAIVLYKGQIGQSDAELKVWFDPTYSTSQLLAQSGEEADLDEFGYPTTDETTVEVTGGGPLRGRLTMLKVPEDILTDLRDRKVGSTTYMEFGETVVDLIVGNVGRLVDLLRTYYGQYWLGPLFPWHKEALPDLKRAESAENAVPMGGFQLPDNDDMILHAVTGESLGDYCNYRLHLQYTLDDEARWHQFQPTADAFPNKIAYHPGDLPRPYHDYLSREDLTDLGRLVQQGEEPPTAAAKIIALARELHDREDWTAALIAAITAFDVAWSEFVAKRKQEEQHIQDALEAFQHPYRNLKTSKIRRIPTNKRVEFATEHRSAPASWGPTSRPPVSRAELYAVIQLRNAVVHEGKDATEEDGPAIYELILIAASLLRGPRYRFVRPLRLRYTALQS